MYTCLAAVVCVLCVCVCGQSVEVKEGLDEKVTISAKRVAYSCFGKVRSLNGEAEKFVPVEAVSATGEVEEVRFSPDII